jgi:hypothetical protein
MTPEETIKAAEVMTAWAKGGDIQACYRQDDERWTDANSPLGSPAWNWYGYRYRLKPEPIKRLIRPDEMPLVFWCRRVGDSTWLLVTEISEMILKSAGEEYHYWDNPGDLAKYEWSADRKEIRSFFVEEGK